MVHLDDDNLDRIIEEFSSDELINLSDDLLKVAIELTLQDDLDLPEVDSIARGNDLLVIIPKVIASRLNKVEIYSRKFASLTSDDLIFVGYSIDELRSIRKLLEDVIALIERRSRDDLHVIYQEIFEDLRDDVEINVSMYRNALRNVNEAYRIQSRHLMSRAIEVYKQVTSYSFEHFFHEKLAVLEEYQTQLNRAIELLESSEIREKYAQQLDGLRKTLILVLEALSAHTIGTGFSKRKLSYIHTILYHIRDDPEEYIFEVISRFANISRDKKLVGYMSPEEIAVRYKTRYIKHNRVLLSFISNPFDVGNDFVLEYSNNILKNLSIALNVKLQFIRTGKLCDQVLQTSSTAKTACRFPYTQYELETYYHQLEDFLGILESYTTDSDYLETLQEKCYRAAIILLEWSKEPHTHEILNVLRRYQIYAARRLFVLRISTLCMFISSRSAQELSSIVSEKILIVCRDLIQFKYDFLKPSSIYLEARFNLDHYRTPVLSKIEEAIQLVQSDPEQEDTPHIDQEDIGRELQRYDPGSFNRQDRIQLKHFFSQLVIDCLALKVQELDDSPRYDPENTMISKGELRMRILSAKERIHYFLRQHEEESQFFMETYQKQEDPPI